MTTAAAGRSVGCMDQMHNTQQATRRSRSSWPAPALPASRCPRTCWRGATRWAYVALTTRADAQ